MSDDVMKYWTMPVLFTPGDPVIAVDPGLHTGIAFFGPDGKITAGEGNWTETITAVRDAVLLYMENGTKPKVVVESFTVSEQTAKNSPAQWSTEAIGAIRWIARRHAIELTMQLPVEAKRFATNPRLKAQGWYIGTPGGHVNDALRHLYLYLAKNGRLIPPEGVV